MNKDELLKIYSVYLPYGLLIETRTDEEIKTEGSYISKLTGVDHLGLHDEFANCWEFEVRPILYDLSYLTKKELRKAGFDDYVDYLTHERDGWVERYGFEEYMDKIPHGHFQYLVSKHYNVFNLPEHQFINKATLTNK